MKKYTLITALTALLLSVLSASYTHNNGDIGKIFGKWKLTYIEATDTEKPETGGTMFWSFQSSTVFVQINDGSHDEIGSYGNFRLADETLFLDFADTDYPNLIPGTERQSEWQLLELTGKKMTLRLQGHDKGYTVWHFTKW